MCFQFYAFPLLFIVHVCGYVCVCMYLYMYLYVGMSVSLFGCVCMYVMKDLGVQLFVWVYACWSMCVIIFLFMCVLFWDRLKCLSHRHHQVVVDYESSGCYQRFGWKRVHFSTFALTYWSNSSTLRLYFSGASTIISFPPS